MGGNTSKINKAITNMLLKAYGKDGINERQINLVMERIEIGRAGGDIRFISDTASQRIMDMVLSTDIAARDAEIMRNLSGFADNLPVEPQDVEKWESLERNVGWGTTGYSKKDLTKFKDEHYLVKNMVKNINLLKPIINSSNEPIPSKKWAYVISKMPPNYKYYLISITHAYVEIQMKELQAKLKKLYDDSDIKKYQPTVPCMVSAVAATKIRLTDGSALDQNFTYPLQYGQILEDISHVADELLKTTLKDPVVKGGYLGGAEPGEKTVAVLILTVILLLLMLVSNIDEKIFIVALMSTGLLCLVMSVIR